MKGRQGLPVALVLATAAVVELALQCWRAFFPMAYHLVGSLGFALTPVVVLAVFAAPLLAWPAWRVAGAGRAAAVPGALAGALVVARLALQAGPTLATAAVAAVVALVAVTVALPAVTAHRFGPDALAAGTLVGLGLDVALRAWRVTDDVVWTQGWAGWLDPSLLIPAGLLLATVSALRGSPTRAAPLASWFVLLMPQLLLWSSLAFVGSSAGMAFSVVTGVTLLGVAAAMAALAWPRARVAWPWSAAVVLLVSFLMPRLDGWSVAAMAVVGTIATPLLVRELAVRARQRPFSAARQAGTAALGSVGMVGLLVLYPLHYEMPLPIDNGWLPALAVVLACLPLVRRGPTTPVSREFATASVLHGPALVTVTAGAVVLAGMTHLGVVGGSPAPGPDPALTHGSATDGELRVATYNLGQGQDATSGRLVLREMAAAIVALDADVVALQEVARGWPLTAMTDMDAWLRAQTDLTVVFTPAADRQFGNALGARVALREVAVLDLGQGGGAQRRSALRATLPQGWRVYGTHLQARNSASAEQTRLDQMGQIVEDWARAPRTIVAGDLNPRNERPAGAVSGPKRISNLEVFTDAGLVTTQSTRVCTEPTSNDNCSDYVFTSPDVQATVPNDVGEVDLSDHRPVLARLARRTAPRHPRRRRV